MGQITWLTGISRPEISFQICEISTRIKSATIVDIKAINKGASFVTSIPNSIMFPRLDPESSSVKMFADASYNNLPNGSSQGEHIVFLSDKSNNSCVVTWNSRSIKRVARSTLAAESLAFSEGCDTAYLILIWPRKQISSMLTQKSVLTLTNNHYTIQSTQQILCPTKGFR